VVAAAVGVRRLLRRLDEPELAAALALAVGVLAYGLHALVDFDWDFVALTAPTLFVVGVLLGSAAPAVRARELRPVWALGAAGIFIGALLSLFSPWLAERRLEDATRAIQRGDLDGTVSAAGEAHSLNPLALEPLLLWAAAEAATEDIAEARRLYSKAVATQPMSPDAWYEYGRFELTVPDVLLAYRYLERSYELDRFGPATDGSLDRARKLVNEAAKRPPPSG
jgi:tetratricopeptide (TPR) repeat protein